MADTSERGSQATLRPIRLRWPIHPVTLDVTPPTKPGGSGVLGRVLAMVAISVVHGCRARFITPKARAFPIGVGLGHSLQVSPMYRVSSNGQEPIIYVAAAEAIEQAIRLFKPGLYHVDEISADSLPSGHTSRRWGVAIKRPDGSVLLEPDPRPT